MGSDAALGDVKLQDRNSAVVHSASPSLGGGPGAEPDEVYNVPHPVHARDGYPPEYWGGRRDSMDGEHVAETRGYYGEEPAWTSAPRPRFGGRDYGYSHLPEQTGYDPAAYR